MITVFRYKLTVFVSVFLFELLFFSSRAFPSGEWGQASRPVLESGSAPACKEPDRIAQNVINHVLGFAIDRSGSMLSVIRPQSILEEISELIGRASPSTLVFIQLIGTDSLLPDELVLMRNLPNLEFPEPCHVSGPFQWEQKKQCLKQKKIQEALKVCVLQLKSDIRESVLNMPLQPSEVTDLNGAWFAVSEILKGFPNAEKHLYVYSDFVDTRKRKLPKQLDFGDTQITLRYLVSPEHLNQADSIQKAQKQLEKSRNLLIGWGVSSDSIRQSFITAPLFLTSKTLH